MWSGSGCGCDVIFVGVLLRKLEAGILGISHVVVDEIHERDINVCDQRCGHGHVTGAWSCDWGVVV